MMELLLGWLKSILRIGILDFFRRIGLKAALSILLTVLVIVAVVFLIIGILLSLLI